MSNWLSSIFDSADERGPLGRLLRQRGLRSVYQPIIELQTGRVYAHEALVRGPRAMPLQSPDALFAAAQREGLLLNFELACVVVALQSWVAAGQSGRLFVNVSANALVQATRRRSIESIVEDIGALGFTPNSLTLEITEHEHVVDVEAFLESARQLRSAGLRFALDDFGDGRSSLRLWAELAPDVVKIDRYFTHDIARHARKVQTIRALMQIADVFGTSLVAEGIETSDELRVMRDLGIDWGQGFFLGRPEPAPRDAPEEAAREVLADPRVAVLPSMRAAGSAGRDLEILPIPALAPTTTNDEVVSLLHANPEWPAVAFAEDDKPLAILERHQFLDRYARGYFKEIFGRKPAIAFANTAPLVIERHREIAELVDVLTSHDQRYLTDGFLITANGRYVGIGTAKQLVSRVTESRIEAALHANPLTLLPGNVPITEHIERLLKSGAQFVACYFDLCDFKPFNDYYGYWRGDEMIKLAASTLLQHINPQRDFLGHVGGDDFVVLFQNDDWEQCCRRAVDRFNEAAVLLYDEAARSAGGICADDRLGIQRFFRFTTLYAGALQVDASSFVRAEDVANAAARVKRLAKVRGLGLAIELAGPHAHSPAVLAPAP